MIFSIMYGGLYFLLPNRDLIYENLKDETFKFKDKQKPYNLKVVNILIAQLYYKMTAGVANVWSNFSFCSSFYPPNGWLFNQKIDLLIFFERFKND